jgi:integrase
LAGESEQNIVKFPKRLRHHGKGKVFATIYERPDGYRLYWRARVDGRPRSRFKDFTTYTAAKKEGDKVVEDLHKGAQAARLSPGQVTDALAALECLRGFYGPTGRQVSIIGAVSQYCDAARKLAGRPLGEAVDGFLSTVASVKRMDLGLAVEQFIESRKPKTVAKGGKRAQLSPGYAYNVAMWLREFARTFPGHAVCDLTKGLLDTYIGQHSDVGPKTRNERRGVVRMFIKWAERQDLLPRNNRLLEADGMAREVAEPEDIELYTAKELDAMLGAAVGKPEFKALVPVVAMIGLGGVRLQEAVRLTWEDVWHVDGHIEISVAKSKTRSRRLVTVCPALAAWLEPYKACSGPVWTQCLDKFHSTFNALLESLKIPTRRNGLRHGFVSYHHAMHANEGLTAAEAGNSPGVIHGNYKGLATKKEAEKWFAVTPQRPANILPLNAIAILP